MPERAGKGRIVAVGSFDPAPPNSRFLRTELVDPDGDGPLRFIHIYEVRERSCR